MLTRTRPSLTQEIIAPSRERIERTIQMTLMTMIVVMIAMTFQIPEPALSTYIVFFVAKEDSGRSILTSVIFIVAIVVIIGVSLALAPIALNHPSLRIVIMAGACFVLFFLGRTSKLAPLAGTLGLVLADALNLEQKAFSGEIETRQLLYAMLFATFPIFTVLVFNIAFGRHPERLLRMGLSARLEVVAAALRGNADHAARRLRSMISAGNVELLTELKMIGLFHRQPEDTLARLKALITVTYRLLLEIEVSRRGDEQVPDREDLAGRLKRLADIVRHLPVAIATRPAFDDEKTAPASDPSLPVTLLATMIEAIVSGAPLPELGPPPPKPPNNGFFKPDAFSNPDGERFAAKSTVAVMLCYLTFNILDWSGISTCMITCFIVALSTVGESTQKMTLRLTGCTLGAALGYAAIVFVLPDLTQITGLLVLIGIITIPGAWIATGSPRVSYTGFQLTFAAYLCVLQGTEPKFDLTIARDRFIGIVFGNLVVFVIFTQVYATSLLPGLTKDLVAILERCRSVLKAVAEAEPVLTVGDKVAGLYALVAKIDAELVAYGFEKRPSRYARLHVQSCRLIESALRDVVADIATIATVASHSENAATTEALHRRCDAVDRRLGDLSAALSERKPIPLCSAEVARRRSDLGALHRHLDGLSVSVQRYRRVLRKEAERYA